MPIPVLALTSGFALLAIVIVIAIVDARAQIIPNELNLVLAATGVGFQWLVVGAFPIVAVLSGAGVFALFWLARTLHSRARGYTGLGFGDVKMAGAGAIWIGPSALPSFVLVSSAAGLAFVLIKSLWAGKLDLAERTPFGPFLALGLFATWAVENPWLDVFCGWADVCA